MTKDLMSKYIITTLFIIIIIFVVIQKDEPIGAEIPTVIISEYL